MGTAERKSNFCVNRSAKQRRCLVPVALRAPAPGYAGRLGVTEETGVGPFMWEYGCAGEVTR